MIRLSASLLLLVGCSSTPSGQSAHGGTADLRYGGELLAAGHFEDAEAHLRAAYDSDVRGVERARVRAQSAAWLGDLYQWDGQLDESVRWFERALAPTTSGRGLRWRTQIATRLAQVLKDLGRTRDAERILAEARGLLHADGAPAGRPERGEAGLLHAQGRDAEAIEKLEGALGDEGDSPKETEDVRMLAVLGHILLETGDPLRAIPHFRRSLELSETYGTFWGATVPFVLVQRRIEYACALRLAGQDDSALVLEDEIRREWDQARAQGYDSRSPWFAPSRLPACKAHALPLADRDQL